MNSNYQTIFWEIIEWGLTYPYHSIFEQIQRNQAECFYKGYQLPEPWNGDIENADVIFVGLNPSYNPKDFFPQDVTIDPKSFWATTKIEEAKVINGIYFNKQRIEDFFENRFSSSASGFGSITTRYYKKGQYYYNNSYGSNYQYVKDFCALQIDTSYSDKVQYWQNAKKLVTPLLGPNAEIGKQFAFLEIIPCKSKGSEGLDSWIGTSRLQQIFINGIFTNLFNQVCSDKPRTFIILGKDNGGKVFHDIIETMIDIPFDDIWGKGHSRLGESFFINNGNNRHKVIFWPHPSGPVKDFTEEKWKKLREQDCNNNQ